MQLYSYATEYKDSDKRMKLLYDICEDKINRIIESELYHEGKTAPTDEERKKAMDEYWERRKLNF